MAKKKSFAEKVQTKVVNKFADKVASGIVKAATTKPKKAPSDSAVAKSTKKTSSSSTTAGSSAPSENAARYNTKKCPECQALCFDAPVTCPYCEADLRSVKPLTPKEFDKLTK